MRETNMNDWDHLPNGNLEALPLASWEAGAAPDVVLMRLEIEMGPGQIGTAQIQIAASEAEEMAKALAFLATRARSGASQGSA